MRVGKHFGFVDIVSGEAVLYPAIEPSPCSMARHERPDRAGREHKQSLNKDSDRSSGRALSNICKRLATP